MLHVYSRTSAADVYAERGNRIASSRISVPCRTYAQKGLMLDDQYMTLERRNVSQGALPEYITEVHKNMKHANKTYRKEHTYYAMASMG